MMHYGHFMAGAPSRLLPFSVPFRFFALAVLFHAGAWGLLLAYAPDALAFAGGAGPVLAALHLITLGVLAMTAIGAALQILPVATGKPLASPRLGSVIFWLFLAGAACLTHGMGAQSPLAMTAGAAMTATALGVFIGLIAPNLLAAKSMPVVKVHGAIALICLGALAVLGLLLSADFQWGFLPDHPVTAHIHLVLAAYGFMGMLAQGFSYILIPLFTLSPPPPQTSGLAAAGLWAAGLALAAVALAMGLPLAAAMAGAIGLAAAGVHLWTMATILRRRMRRHLGYSFLLIGSAWIMLPLSLILGIAVLLAPDPGPLPTLFVFILVFGWLLGFLLGVLQRILPFLASMHSIGKGRKPLLVSALTVEPFLRAHLICHMSALALCAAGIVTAQAPVFRLGAAAGLAGALCFALFAGQVWRRLAAHIRANPTPATVPPEA